MAQLPEQQLLMKSDEYRKEFPFENFLISIFERGHNRKTSH